MRGMRRSPSRPLPALPPKPNSAPRIATPWVFNEEAVRLLVEVRLSGEPLTGMATHQTELLPHRTLAKVPLTGLKVGQKYVLKLKVKDARGAATTWGGLFTELTIGEP
jgi:hypothetical protein